MHDSAHRIGELVMRMYTDLPNAKILEVGSLNVNGCLRDVAEASTHYVGLDLEQGPSVDLILTPGADFPVDENAFDLVIASSVFEHDARFWDTFVRMCRAARPGGHIYVNAPSNGSVHRYPVDCWRFYPDAGLALADHARSEGLEIDLIESFIGSRHSDVWNDFVAIFRKGPSAEPLNTSFVYQRYPSLNARTWQSHEIYNPSDSTEDMQIIKKLREQCEDQTGHSAELERTRAELSEVQHKSDELDKMLLSVNSENGVLQDKIEGLLEQKSGFHQDIAKLMGELGQSRSDVRDLKLQVQKLTDAIANLRKDALQYHSRAAQALEQLSDLRAEYGEQARMLSAMEDRSLQKDREMAWLRAVYQMLEADGNGWRSFLPPQFRKRRLMRALQKSGLFDSQAYLDKYVDVARVGMDPLRHYILHGMAEGRHTNT